MTLPTGFVQNANGTITDPTFDNGRGRTFTQNGANSYTATDYLGRTLGTYDSTLGAGSYVAPPTGGTTSNLGTENSILNDNGKTYTTSPDLNTATTVNNTVTPGNADTVVAPPSTTANASNTAPGSPNNPQPATTAPTSTGTPTAPWAPGHTGADVKALQDMLVSKGFMTSAEVATGPGIFGPKTQAALAKYQMQNGGGSPTSSTPSTTSQDTSGGSSSSGTSTYTNQPATPTTPAKSAVQQVIDDYTTAYQSLGLGDIKAQYQKFVQDQTDLTNKQNDEKAAIDNNPWMTQGIKDNTKAQIDKKYETRQNTLTHQIDLLDSLYKQGQQEVESIVNKSEAISMEQQKEAQSLAQKQVDAANALILEKNKASDAVNLKTTTPGKAPSSPKSSSSSPAGTVYTKGKLSNNEWVNLSLSRLGFAYKDALAKVPSGKIGVINNKTGQFGSIDPLDYTTSLYTKI